MERMCVTEGKNSRKTHYPSHDMTFIKFNLPNFESMYT